MKGKFRTKRRTGRQQNKEERYEKERRFRALEKSRHKIQNFNRRRNRAWNNGVAVAVARSIRYAHNSYEFYIRLEQCVIVRMICGRDARNYFVCIIRVSHLRIAPRSESQ